MTVELEKLRPLGLQPHPLDKPRSLWTVLSRFTLSWVWELLRFRHVLEPEDVWPPPRLLSCKVVGLRAATLWANELKRPHPSLLKTLLRIGWVEAFWFWNWSFVVAVGWIATPIFLRVFLSELAGDRDLSTLIGYGVGYLVFFLIIAFSIANCKWQAQVLGLKLRTATQRLIYHSCLFLPVDSLNGVTSPANLMSVDAERYFLGMNVFFPHMVYLVGIYPLLLIEFLGWVPAAVCVVLAVASTAMQQFISKRLAVHRKLQMGVADRRLQLTDQYIQGIRVLKMNGWTSLAEKRLEEVRRQELAHLFRVFVWKGLNMTLGLSSPCAIGILVFASYALMDGEMTPEVVFPSISVLRALQLFMTKLPQTFSLCGEMVAAHGRIADFLKRFPPREQPVAVTDSQDTNAISLRNATFTRGGTAGAPSPCASPSDQQTATRKTFELGPLTLHVGAGEFCVVCGPVGSGKSSLLLGMLGELSPSTGEVSLVNDVALCGQEPWMLSASLRDNVVCLRAPDEESYQGAVVAAQLLSDFDTLPAGDDTEIGPRGINISGGQKARVALSRALFGVSAKVVLLDDVLSAVDVHVARRIVDEVLLGSLRDKTRVLVANTFLPLLLPSAHVVVVLGPQGNIDVVGSPAEALSSSDWLRDAVASMGGCVLTDAADLPPQDLQHFALGDEAPVTHERSNALSLYRTRTGRVSGVEVSDGSLLVAEDRVVGALNVWAYTAFFREATSKRSAPLGSAIFAFVLILVLAAEACRTMTDIMITLWTKNSGEEGARGDAAWIRDCTIFLVGLILIQGVRVVVYSCTVKAISARTHGGMLKSVLGASVPLFFDVVPTGRVLNRFSKDLDSLDTQLPDWMAEFFQLGATVVGVIVVLVITSYWILLALPLFVFGVYRFRKFYSKTSREMKRLESIARSPIYSHFQETLSGLVHIRAYGLLDSMMERFEEKVDDNIKLFIHLYALLPWLMLRLNLSAACAVGVVVIVTIIFRNTLDPTMAGFALAACSGLIGSVHICITASIETENQLTSVERLEHFRLLSQEGSDAAMEPQKTWPPQGEVAFEDVRLRYRPHLPFVLDGISFKITAGHRAGIIGRTGSGKSTCMLALLRIVELSGGRILIDGEDIAKVPLQVLRGRAVAIIPQDPYLFEGTILENIDPFGMSTVETCHKALEDTQLAEVVSAAGGLGGTVHSNGANFSVGQRQLLCIARAMLRRAPVVLLDEASANIDAGTDAAIQETIRGSFGTSTLMIIAHRLSTIADSDLIVCMDKGLVVDIGPPQELRQAGGPVAEMFAEAGDVAS